MDCIYSPWCRKESDTTKQVPLSLWASLVARSVKNLPGVQETRVLIPGLGRSQGEGNGPPFQYSCLENPTDRGRGAWQATVP